MANKLQEIFSIPELKRRVLFTIGLLVVYRVGSHITTPGVDASVLTEFFARQRGTILGLYDLFAGGNLSKATIFALPVTCPTLRWGWNGFDVPEPPASCVACQRAARSFTNGSSGSGRNQTV